MPDSQAAASEAAPSRPGADPPSPHASAAETPRVFLSPRVVDQNAFTDYAARLRALVDETTAAADGLRAELRAAADTRDEVKRTGSNQRAALDAAAKLLKSLDARVEQGAKVLADLDAGRSKLDELERAIARVSDERIEAFTKKLDDAFAQRTEELERRVEERLAALDRQTADRSREIARRFDAEASRVEDLASRVAELDDGRVRVLESTFDKAARLAGWDPDDVHDGVGAGAPARDSLGDFVLRGEAMRESTDAALHRLTQTKDAAEDAARSLGETLAGSMSLVDDLEAKRDELESHVRHTIDAAQRAADDADERAQRVRELAEPIARAQQDAETTLASIRDELAAAERTNASVGESIATVRRAVDEARRVASELEPWRDVLDADAGELELPPALAAIADGFRGELAQDLAKMAAAMNMIAHRAETTIRHPAGDQGGPEVVIKVRETQAQASEKADG